MSQTSIEKSFAAGMARRGPFGARPRLAVAVSGGADSTALALLAQDWAVARQGEIQALIVDHGLRASSADEAALTARRLAERGIAVQILTLSGLAGPGLQARARAARYAALQAAAKARGCVHLLLGHHAADQTETVAMRAARGESGLEGMPGWAARHDIVIIRPLLDMLPADLRAYLHAEAMEWVEDPSNRDRRFERVRARQDALQDGKAGAADVAPRLAREAETAAFLARHVSFRPEGFALLNASAAPPTALAALLRVIGGADFPPARDKVAALAAKLRPATLGGVRIAPAGRVGAGWLLAREPAACAPGVPALAGAVWDRRFHLLQNGPAGALLGPLGADAAHFRRFHNLPALVLRGMPCLRAGNAVICFPAQAMFIPPAPATSHPFLP
jgi:tRNA(Ile)-lysidine synthase